MARKRFNLRMATTASSNLAKARMNWRSMTESGADVHFDCDMGGSEVQIRPDMLPTL
jgi:hypothetical protein